MRLVTEKINQENIMKFIRICDSFRNGTIDHLDADDKQFMEMRHFVSKRYGELKQDNSFSYSADVAKAEMFFKMFGEIGEQP